jgi:GMP synthase-like glutamine amidotransferase
VVPLTFKEDPQFHHQASSERTPNELWTFGDRILSMQPHPELNHIIIQKGIIDRLYKIGRLDERQKKESE